MEFIYKYRKIIFAVLIIVAAIIIIPQITKISVEDIIKYTPDSLPLAAAVVIGIFCLKSALTVIPVIVLYLSTGILFPVGWAILVAYIGLTLELSISYYLGHKIGRDRVERLMDKSKILRKLFRAQKDNSATSCFIIRILPAPIDLVSMFFGASGMNYGSYMLFSLLGLTPGMIPYVMAGRAIKGTFSREILIPFVICVCVSVLIYIIIQNINKKRHASSKA